MFVVILKSSVFNGLKMIININELEPNKPIEIEIDEDFEELCAHADGILTVKMTGNFVFVRGNIEATLESECARCLKKFEETININIDEKFFNGALTPVTSKEHQLKGDDFAEELGENEEIDLSDLIYQSIIINVPSQSLCDENCKGVENLDKYIKADENLQRIEIPLKLKNNDNK